jgi:hypothetical protein
VPSADDELVGPTGFLTIGVAGIAAHAAAMHVLGGKAVDKALDLLHRLLLAKS